MRFVINGIIFSILSIFVYSLYQALPIIKVYLAHPSEFWMPLASGAVILILGIYALVAVFRRSPYHRTAAFIFFAAYVLLVFSVVQNSIIKHAMSFPGLGIIMLAIDALIFWI